jgi:hypothetical protein
MKTITFNGQTHDVDAAPETPLLDGAPVRTCVVPLAALGGQAITTIEGFANGERLHPVQQAGVDHQVPQCGYCQSGMILGTSPARIDIPAKVDGSAMHGFDVRPAGTVYGAIAQSPVIGGAVASVDRDHVIERPGVRAVVELPVRV